MPFCTHCRAANPPGARYCNDCGTRLSGAVCGGCGGSNREGARFCDQCGASLAAGVAPRRVLVTVLFTDIVESTAQAASLGDGPWRLLLERHHGVVRAELARWGGRELDTAGDGFFARFDRPAGAIECARAIVPATAGLGLSVRVGIHTGECELIEDKVGGLAVAIGARVCAAAGGGEILVSSTVRDLVAGSGLGFTDRGAHSLRGLDAEWRLFAVR